MDQWAMSPFENEAAGVIPAAFCGVAVHVFGQSQDYSNATLEQFRVHLEACFGVDLAQHPFIAQECDCDAGFFEPDCILKGCRHTREEQPAQILGMGAP